MQYHEGPRGVAVTTVTHFPRSVNIRRHVSDQTSRLAAPGSQQSSFKKLCFCEIAGSRISHGGSEENPEEVEAD